MKGKLFGVGANEPSRAELCVVLARPVYQTSLNSSSTVEPNQAFNEPSLELLASSSIRFPALYLVVKASLFRSILPEQCL